MLFSPFLPFALDIGLRFTDLPGIGFSKERDEVIFACPLPVFELRIFGDGFEFRRLELGNLVLKELLFQSNFLGVSGKQLLRKIFG